MARSGVAAPLPAPRGGQPGARDALHQPAGAARRHGRRTPGPFPPVAHGDARGARRHRHPPRRAPRADALPDRAADLLGPARHLLGPAGDHRRRRRRHRRAASGERRCRPDVRQAQGKHRRAAQGHVDGVRRLAVRPVGIAGAGLPRTAGEPSPGPLPYRARGMAGRRHPPVEQRHHRGRAGRVGLCRSPARAHRRRPRRPDAHLAARRGRPRSHGRRQRHSGRTAGCAGRSDARAADLAGPHGRAVDRAARGDQSHERARAGRRSRRADGAPARHRSPPRPPGRGECARPHRARRRAARRVQDAGPHHPSTRSRRC